jgi:hypothetical protein
MRTLSTPLGLLVLLAGPSAAGTFHRVDAAGGGDFVDLQPAVDAAQDGDVILVHPGAYSGFVVDGLGLWIVGLGPERATVTGTVELRNVPAGSKLVLAGLEGVAAPPASSYDPPEPGLWVHDNAGHVRIQDAAFTGSPGVPGFEGPGAAGGAGAECSASLSLVLDGVSLTGGNGAVFDDGFATLGGRGGDGAVIGGSLAAAYGSTFLGGRGASVDFFGPAGNGGHGCVVPSFGLYASGSSFTGGRGGNNDDFLPGDAGHGGHGLVVSSSAQAQLLANAFAGGAGGVSFAGSGGASGQPTSGGGIFHQMSGAARLVTGARLAPDGGTVELELRGAEGDQVWLAGGRGTNFQFAVQKKGVWLVPRPPALPLLPVGTIPAGGTLGVQVPAVDLGPGFLSAGWLMQAFVRTAGGEIVLGGPHALLLANCETLAPDCNANGDWDACDVLRTTSLDCDLNFVPDECQPDCNGNGSADSCDIAGGASADTNGNGVPDECEPVSATWWIDPAAAPGGDGSAAFPFRTLREGVLASLSGHEIVLRDGLYTGADNRELDFSGRTIVVRSLNGPAACVVDLELQGRAFRFLGHQNNQAARIEGITFRNGRKAPASSGYAGAIEIDGSSPTIVDCVFESCEAASGGALRVRGSASLIRGCRFVGNRHTSAGFEGGGALFVSASNGLSPRIVECDFVGNTAVGVGGAVRANGFSATWPVYLSHCRFLGNSGGLYGGALAGGSAAVRVEQCRFEGNAAQYGGAIGGSATMHVHGCTLVANAASVEGGAISRDFSGGGFVRDTLVWGNTAPLGAQIALRGNGTLTVEFSDVQGGQAAVAVAGSSVLTWGSGNLDQDPLFVDPDGPDDLPGTYDDNDWRLGSGSPCVDAGSNALVPPDRFDLDGDLDVLEPVPFDLLLQPRLVDDPAVPDTGSGAPPLVDLGAHERQP